MQIRVKDQTHEIYFTLNDSDAADALVKQLPLTLEVKNYSNDEKIFYPKNKLATDHTPATDAEAGDLAYFAPWGDVVMFYKAFATYPGLYILGKAVKNAGKIQQLNGKITISQL